MFHDRQQAAEQLAVKLQARKLHQPLVLGIPRGGVVIGAALAAELDAELDIVLSRKLRAPHQPEFAIGAVAENAQVYLNPDVTKLPDLSDEYLRRECRQQFMEIERRKKIFRQARPQARVDDRSVIVTDDGIATGATMIAALQGLKAQKPREVIVAAPVAAPDPLNEIRRWCDELIFLRAPEAFWAVGQFYEDFRQVEDEEVVELLHAAARREK